MFDSLRSLIDSRLGKKIVLDDFIIEDDFFIKIHSSQLYSVAFFLKNDPDVRLTLFDQIVILPAGILPWPLTAANPSAQYGVLYQLKSLKLPYRVSLVLEIDAESSLPSITPLYAGARWQEQDLCAQYGCMIEVGERQEQRV